MLRISRFFFSSALIIAFFSIELPSAHAHGGPDFYHVRSTGDAGPGTLREAITFANDDEDTQIAFQIPRDDPNFDAKTGVFTIKLLHPLPRVTGEGTHFDGLAQTLLANSNPRGPEICLSGEKIGDAPALVIAAPNCQIKGLAFANFQSHAILVSGAQTTQTRVLSNDFQKIRGAALVFSAGAHENWVGLAPRPASEKEAGDDDEFAGIYGEIVGLSDANTFGDCGEGVRVAGSDSVGNSIRGNRFEAVELPINLRFEGENTLKTSQNDALDADDGPNDGQNAPVIRKVERAKNQNALSYQISGIFDGAPNQKLTLDIYWDAQTPSADGKTTGQTTLEIQTDQRGHADWQTIVRGYPAGNMRATITNSSGSTSEMSAIFDVPWLY